MAPSDWMMRGEGNANVVLAYVGTDSDLAGAVLRARKAGAAGHGGGAAEEAGAALQPELWQGCFEWSSDAMEREVRYIGGYLGPKLGHDFVHPGVMVPLPEDAVAVLQAHGRQPAPGAPALLLCDHTVISQGLPGYTACGPVVCVEVKPKCGFVTTSPHVSAANAVKLQHPRFVLQQFMMHTQKHLPLCRYNPLDLFSGTPKRVSAALQSLLDVPNNNLRIFKDGLLVYGGRPGADAAQGPGAYTGKPATRGELDASLSTFAFPGPAPPQAAAAAGVSAGVRTMHLVQQAFQETGVLQNLLELQRLDRSDIEAILPLYNQLLAPAASAPADTAAGGAAAAAAAAPALSRSEAVVEVRDYLTSATGKDCSIMVTLQPVAPSPPARAGDCATPPASPPAAAAGVAAAAVPGAASYRVPAPKLLVDAATGVSYVYKLAFVDLDIKHPSKIPGHHDLDTRIMDCVRKDADAFAALMAAAP